MRVTESRDIPELCGRLHRETSAEVVLVLAEDGAILGHAGSPGLLDDEVVGAIGDALVAAVNGAGAAGQPDDEDLVSKVGDTQLCAARLGHRHVLVVVFDHESSAALVRLQMKRARELILRSLDAV